MWISLNLIQVTFQHIRSKDIKHFYAILFLMISWWQKLMIEISIQEISLIQIQSFFNAMLTFVTALSYACIALQVAVLLPWSQRNFVNHLIFRIRSHPLTSIETVVSGIRMKWKKYRNTFVYFFLCSII